MVKKTFLFAKRKDSLAGMGLILSMIPTEGIGLCIVASVIIFILIVLAVKIFGTNQMILQPKKKASFFNILKDAARAHREASE